MAMNNSLYGFAPPSSSLSSLPYSAQFSSTPANPRPQRPRFAFSNVPSYPRPRSSATKPNPEIYSENMKTSYGDSDTLYNVRNKYENSDMMYDMRNNYGNIDSMRNNFGNIDSMRNSFGEIENMNTLRSNYSDNLPDNSRTYYGNNDTIIDSMRNNYGSPSTYRNESFSLESSSSNLTYESSESSAYYSCNNSFFDSPKYSPVAGTAGASGFLKNTSSLPFSSTELQNKSSNFGLNSGKEHAGHFQNKSNQQNSSKEVKSQFYKKKYTERNKAAAVKHNPFPHKKPEPAKRQMAAKSEWRCSVCSIDFTSAIPYEMHLRGAKHAKKVKSQDVLQSIQMRVAQSSEISTVGNAFRCELCNVHANSSLQFQTHLDGVKHKNKVLQQTKEKLETEPTPVDTQVNGKSNGSTVRPLPADFGEPPSKLAKFSCDICNVIVNSDIQLQQHLSSKKHQAKVEGKPIAKRKSKPKQVNDAEKDTNNATDATADNIPDTAENMDITNVNAAESKDTKVPKVVVGIKTLSSSFVQGETQH